MPGMCYDGTLTIVNSSNSLSYTLYYIDELIEDHINGRRCYYCKGLGYRVKYVIKVLKIEKEGGYAGEIKLTSWLGRKLIRIAKKRLLHGRVSCKNCDKSVKEEAEVLPIAVDVKL